MGIVKVPKWRVIVTNMRGDKGTYMTCQTKAEAKREAADLRTRNKVLKKAKAKLWIGYKSVRVERTPYSKPRPSPLVKGRKR